MQVIKKWTVMERKRSKQQKMFFVNSIFNRSVSKLVKWQSWQYKADNEKTKYFLKKSKV